MAQNADDPGRVPLARRLRRLTDRARDVADTLKEEYRKGLAGDDSPVAPVGPSAITAIRAWLSRDNSDDEVDGCDPESTAGFAASDEEATEVADLLGGVDWKKVSNAVRDSQTAQRMRDLADQVDWAAAKPVAGRVAAALIAAAAAGELGGLEGRSARYVARTIANETGLAERVARRVSAGRGSRSGPLLDYIETTATELPAAGFDQNLADLERFTGQNG
jgi:hypothetical protein